MNFSNVSDKEFIDVVKTSNTVIGVLRKLKVAPYGRNYSSFNSRVIQLGLDTSHFINNYSGRSIHTKKTPTNVLFSKNNRRAYGGQLKRRLISEGIKRYVCESCGNSEWKGLPIPLETHHRDGDNFNNEIENLELLCPNCHSFTENYRKGNKSPNKRIEGEYKCSVCGVTVSSNGVKCRDCYDKERRDKSKKPDRLTLLKDLSDRSYGVWERVGRKYHVSGNAVKKWARNYKLL